MTKLTGGLNNYYVVPIKNPQRKEQEPYQAECEDIIQALGMTFDEGCAFKALWRNAAARMGNGKPGNKALYDCEKLVHYANRILKKEELAQANEPFSAVIPNPAAVKAYADQTRGDGWVHSSTKPIITQPYESIEVVYRNGKKCEFNSATVVDWEYVWKYRINYS